MAGILSIRPIIVVLPCLRNVVVAEILLTNSVFKEGHEIAIDRGLGFSFRTIDQGVSRQKREVDAVEGSGLDLHQLGQIDGKAVPLAVIDVAIRNQLDIPIEYHSPDAGQLLRLIPIVDLKKLVHIGIGYPHDGQPHCLEIDRFKRKDSPRSSGHDHSLPQRSYLRLAHFKIYGMRVYAIQLIALGASDVGIKDYRFFAKQPCGGIDLDDIAPDKQFELFTRF